MSDEAINQKEERARECTSSKRSSMSPEEKDLHLAKERDRDRSRRADPKNRASQTESKRRTIRRKIANGICVSCLDLATCGRYCFDHWLHSVGREYGLTIKNGGVEIIRSLWNEQVGICALTGEKLVPSQNASLDHILPRCRGGTNDRGNLQWVTKDANFFKRARTNIEIVQISLKIVRYAERGASNVSPIKKLSSSEAHRVA